MNEYSKLILTSTNQLLSYLNELPEVPCGFPSNDQVAKELNVSRTTVQKVIDLLCEKGIARKDGTNKILLRKPKSSDYFSNDELDNSKADLVEKQILKKISSYELKPGDRFSELELARELNSNTVTLREALFKISHNGILKKHPRQKWQVVQFSLEMIEEIAAIRKLYEGYAIQSIKKLSKSDPIWDSFTELERLHIDLLKSGNIRFDELIKTERAFHTTLIKACQNRFIEESYNSVFTLITFYLWQTEYDQPKITRVFKQHLNILRALLNRDFLEAIKAMELHLEHSKTW